jgi:hypothetical protein
MRYGERQRDAGGFRVADLPAPRPPDRELGRVAYFGCKTVTTATLGAVDDLVARDSDRRESSDEGAADRLNSAEFAVIDPRCHGAVTSLAHAGFDQAPRWGELTLWLRRPTP